MSPTYFALSSRRTPSRYCLFIAWPEVCLFCALFLLVSLFSARAAEDATNAPSVAKLQYNLNVEEFQLKKTEHWLSILGFGGTAVALIFGYFQYRKADQWKRAEFVANEMKEFFGDRDVQCVLLMIDWAPRRINLFQIVDPDPKKYPKITRAIQVSALEPHSLRAPDSGSIGLTTEMAKTPIPEVKQSNSRWQKLEFVMHTTGSSIIWSGSPAISSLGWSQRASSIPIFAIGLKT